MNAPSTFITVGRADSGTDGGSGSPEEELTIR